MATPVNAVDFEVYAARAGSRRIDRHNIELEGGAIVYCSNPTSDVKPVVKKARKPATKKKAK